MQTTTSVVLFTFIWLLVHPTALAAQTLAQSQPLAQPRPPSTETEFAEALVKIAEKLATLQEKLTRAENARLEEEDLKQWRKRLEHLDARMRKTFERMEQHLQDKGLPAEILQRHQEMIVTYEAELATLRRNLDTLAAASTNAARKDKAAQALQHLQTQQQHRPSRRFDPHHLPFRVPDGKVRKPRETKEEFQALLFAPPPIMMAATDVLPGLLASAQAAALPARPTPDDLAPTEDVQLTAEITALAVQLNNNPVKIYNWVHDNIEFLPTYGSIQGSHMTLQTKRGNAFDTASLLIALLRAANIPARYGYGTVQIPMARVMNWVGGVTVPEAVLQVLGQGGIPSIGLVQGGAIMAVKLEHVWVEAWVDFEPSRGAVHREGDTWVPLDASFKQYQHTVGMDLQEKIPFDAQAFVNQVTASAQVNEVEGWVSRLDHTVIQNTLTTYLDQVNAYVATQKSNATVGDVLGTKTIVPARRPVLALGLPYTVVVRGNVWTQIPDTLRHKFRFHLYATALDQILDAPILSLTQSLPMLAGKKLTLSFAPASQADADLVASYFPRPVDNGSPMGPSGLPTSLPGYLIRLVAELRIDGQVVARGGLLIMGQELVSTMGVSDPTHSWQEVDNVVIAGEYQAVGIDAAGIAASQVQTLQTQLATTKAKLEAHQFSSLTQEDLLGDLLYTTVLSYFAANDLADHLNAGIVGTVTYRRPSFGRFTLVAQPQYWFGIPQTVTFPGVEMDMDHLVSIVVSKVNNRESQVVYVRNSGLRQSALEHLVPELLFTTADQPGQAISAVRALAIASQQGQRLYTITPATIANVLPQLTLASEVQAEIQEAVAVGQWAVVSQHPVTVGGWTGVGYLLLDPETGSGAYKISGGANGSLLLLAGLATVAIGLVFFTGGIGLAATAAIAAVDVEILSAAGVLLSLLGVGVSGISLGHGAKWSDIISYVCFIYGTVVSTAVPTILALANLLLPLVSVVIATIGITFNYSCLFFPQ